MKNIITINKRFFYILKNKFSKKKGPQKIVSVKNGFNKMSEKAMIAFAKEVMSNMQNDNVCNQTTPTGGNEIHNCRI